jgi:hypothetical protein
VKEVTQNVADSKDLRYKLTAVQAIQEAAEQYLVSLRTTAALACRGGGVGLWQEGVLQHWSGSRGSTSQL